jgi:hypothetical protein
MNRAHLTSVLDLVKAVLDLSMPYYYCILLVLCLLEMGRFSERLWQRKTVTKPVEFSSQNRRTSTYCIT